MAEKINPHYSRGSILKDTNTGDFAVILVDYWIGVSPCVVVSFGEKSHDKVKVLPNDIFLSGQYEKVDETTWNAHRARVAKEFPYSLATMATWDQFNAYWIDVLNHSTEYLNEIFIAFGLPPVRGTTQ